MEDWRGTFWNWYTSLVLKCWTPILLPNTEGEMMMMMMLMMMMVMMMTMLVMCFRLDL